MRREAKRNVFSAVSLHPLTSAQTNEFSAAGSFSSAPVKTTRASSRGGTGSSFGHSNRPESFTARSCGRTVTPSKKTSSASGTGRETRSLVGDVSGGLAGQGLYSTTSLRGILGVRVPLSLLEEDDGASSLDTGSGTSVALDVPRVHQLQRDLVNFSRQAYSFSQMCDEAEGGCENSSLDDQKNSQSGRVVRAQSLIQLRQSCRTLLLHSACLAPLLPLACASPALSSSQTGLDALLSLV